MSHIIAPPSKAPKVKKIEIFNQEVKCMRADSSLQYNTNNIISRAHVKISSNNRDTRDIKAMQKMGSASPINHS